LLNERYEVLVKKLKLDVDFTKISDVQIAMNETDAIASVQKQKEIIKLNKGILMDKN
jgi:hypothetical protein